MNNGPGTRLRIGAWTVDEAAGQVSRGEQSVKVEARAMRLLLCLARNAGQVVSIDELLAQAWSGVIVTPDSIYQAVASLRRTLADDSRDSQYIATVPRLGYRLVAPVSPWPGEPAASDGLAIANASHANGAAAIPNSGSARRRLAVLLLFAVAVCAALGVTLLAGKGAPPRSVAVLPFLDLTSQEMNEEYFADGMTEELIDKISKLPGFRVPGSTASFYFKSKQRRTVPDIAKALGVVYVLEGNIRESGATLRVATQLVRARDGYVVWSETYDRPMADKLQAQADIADHVAQAVRASIQ
jgi:transcriptional activator of cad operon